jgi:hypothetical protein
MFQPPPTSDVIQKSATIPAKTSQATAAAATSVVKASLQFVDGQFRRRRQDGGDDDDESKTTVGLHSGVRCGLCRPGADAIKLFADVIYEF